MICIIFADFPYAVTYKSINLFYFYHGKVKSEWYDNLIMIREARTFLILKFIAHIILQYHIYNDSADEALVS